jgi:undecaprenyl-diphosphatase
LDPEHHGHDRAPGAIPPSRAIVLGAVQGPAELLPVSSSAHLTLIPWLAGWDDAGRDPELQKSFEVSLHAGAAAALLVGQRQVIAGELRSLDARKASVLALSFLPPALCGLVLERPIERRLGGPLSTAVGLLAGAAAMVAADRRPQLRDRGHATAVDGLALGLAQAAALVPGISRNGATLTAARWRGFTRQHSNMLSRTVALPVILGAAVLKGARLRRRGLPRSQRTGFAAGTATSFASTLASQALIRLVERDSALWPYAVYRAGLASVILTRMWRRSRRNASAAAGYSQPGGFASGAPVATPGIPSAGNGEPAWASATGEAGAGRRPKEEPR